MPLSGTHQNEIWEKLLHFKKCSQTGSNIFSQLHSHVPSDMHHTLSLAMVTVTSHSLILEKIKVNLDFLIGWGFFKKTV